MKAEVEKEYTGDGKLYVWSEEDTVVLDNDCAQFVSIIKCLLLESGMYN